jgi:hypothetical protein
MAPYLPRDGHSGSPYSAGSHFARLTLPICVFLIPNRQGADGAVPAARLPHRQPLQLCIVLCSSHTSVCLFINSTQQARL